MSIKLFLVFLAVSIFIPKEQIQAQDTDIQDYGFQLECSDISYASSLQFVRFMEKGDMDSARIVLDYWESKCGIREPIFRSKILLALKTGEFKESMLTEDALQHVFNYINRMYMIRTGNYVRYDYAKPHYGFIPPAQELDQYLIQLAGDLRSNYDSISPAYLIADFYSSGSDAILTRLQSSPLKQTGIGSTYNNTAQRYLRMPELHIAGIAGIWIPTGGISKLGVHPELGFLAGVKYKRMSFDLIMACRFLRSPNRYLARRTSNAELEWTDHYFGGHMGFDFSYDLHSQRNSTIQLLAGIAIDGFDAFKSDRDSDKELRPNVVSNFSFGLGYRYYVSYDVYLGLRAKYNIVDYSANNIVEFNGHPITIQFVIGGLYNLIRNDNLKALKYNRR